MILPATGRLAAVQLQNQGGAYRPSHGRCAKIRLLFCEPWLVPLVLRKPYTTIPRQNHLTSFSPSWRRRPSAWRRPWPVPWPAGWPRPCWPFWRPASASPRRRTPLRTRPGGLVGLRLLGAGGLLGTLGLGLGRLAAFGQDLGDLHQGEFLALTALAARILAPALLEGDDGGVAILRDHLGRHHGTRDARRAHLDVVAAQQQHFAELDDIAGLARDLVDLQPVVGRDAAVLLTAGLDEAANIFRPRVRLPALGSGSGPASLQSGLVFGSRPWGRNKARGPFDPRSGRRYGVGGSILSVKTWPTRRPSTLSVAAESTGEPSGSRMSRRKPT